MQNSQIRIYHVGAIYFRPANAFAMGTILRETRNTLNEMINSSYGNDWTNAIHSGLAIAIDRLVD